MEVIITTEPRNHTDADLQEVANRHDDAVSAMGTVARALDLIPLLAAETDRLRTRLARSMADFHNLIAAARATLRAHAEGEDDALYYLRDELEAQGQLPSEHRDRS
jgi:hypothetical protein